MSDVVLWQDPSNGPRDHLKPIVGFAVVLDRGAAFRCQLINAGLDTFEPPVMIVGHDPASPFDARQARNLGGLCRTIGLEDFDAT